MANDLLRLAANADARRNHNLIIAAAVVSCIVAITIKIYSVAAGIQASKHSVLCFAWAKLLL